MFAPAFHSSGWFFAYFVTIAAICVFVKRPSVTHTRILTNRGRPVFSSQRLPALAPQVGHDTEDIYSGVSSFAFMH
jgi:hypothetical protein